ncbi:MAG: hypothetical protein WAM39_30525 [Bryobacteraceae bacterium]
MLGSEELVRQVLDDLEASSLLEKEKALFRFVAKVNQQAAQIGAEDIELLHSIGWTDEAVYYAISVCALFNFYNRWIDASGVAVMSEQAHRHFGKRTADNGYIRR